MSVGNIFKGQWTRTAAGAGPAEDRPTPHDGNNAEKPDAMPMIHDAIRENDLIAVGKILQAFPAVVHEKDDRRWCQHIPFPRPPLLTYLSPPFIQRA